MSGKSNILDVFRFLYEVFFPETGTQGVQFALAQRGGINEVLWNEEPENHLHPRLLETLVSLLRQVRQEAHDSGQLLPQIILTTQSPYLVDKSTLDEIVWIEKRNGETSSYRPADKHHLKTLIENKELGLADLMFSGALGEER